jgi:hypothetical protein
MNAPLLYSVRQEMKKLILGLLLCHLAIAVIQAQGEISGQSPIFYRNEKSVAILLNSNGYGINGRYAKRINARRKTVFDIDFVGIKHPKEVKISNNYFSNRSFVYGKENSVFNLRVGYGKQKEMFRKIDKGGISIRRFFSFGPTAALMKPIYYEVYETNPSNPSDLPFLSDEKFNTSIHQSSIYGRSSFFKGFNEIDVLPGIYGRLGVSFEYSRQNVTLHALEGGLMIDAFPKKIPIMATEDNNFIFVTLFISYRFGKIVDDRNIIDEKDLVYYR